MPTFGPTAAEIAIVTDYPVNGELGLAKILSKLSALGVVSTGIFITSLLEQAPPLTEGEPDIDLWINTKRKTPPDASWTRHGGMAWVHQSLATGLQKVLTQLAEVKPRIVITVGKAPLVMLCEKDSITDWSGSRLSLPQHPFTVIPTFHPRVLNRQPADAFMLGIDLTRAYNVYTGKQLPRHYHFTIRPHFEEVTNRLLGLLAEADARAAVNTSLRLSADIETRAGHIACMGIAWSETEAICVPHMIVRDENPFYWTLDDEAFIVNLYTQLFAHPNIEWIGQNFTYDCQYFWRHWGMYPIGKIFDTMVGHHSLHSNIKKGLAFLSRMYAQDHVYWKDELYEWDITQGEEQYWTYNCKDCCITFEIAEQIKNATLERT